MIILNLTLRHMLLFESRYLHRDYSVCYKLVMLTDIFEEVSTQQLRVRRDEADSQNPNIGLLLSCPRHTNLHHVRSSHLV